MASRRPADVWIVNQYADAPDHPAGTRHFDLARRLVAQGHGVLIFATGFSHITRREERLAALRPYRVESFDGVRFVWVRTLPYQGNTWRRYVNMLTFFVMFLVVQTRFPAPTYVIGSTVHPFAALAAWIAARLRGGRFAFEIRDLWPQTLVDLGAMRDGSVAERSLRTIEALLVRRACVVIALLPGIAEYLRGRGLPADAVVYIPNGVDLETFDADPGDLSRAPGSVRDALGSIARLRAEGRFVLGYVGSFGRVNRLDIVVHAGRLAEEESPGSVGVIVVGDGPERGGLERLAAGAGNVVIAGAIPKRWVPTVLAALDGTVVHVTWTPVYRYGISFNKLFEYLAASRPVVFACESAYDPVAEAGAGISIPPDDAGALSTAFLALAGMDNTTRARMGAAGRAWAVEHHDIGRLGDELTAALEGCR
jgi:glycosyltransferase involved in cell wall biosynthesis